MHLSCILYIHVYSYSCILYIKNEKIVSEYILFTFIYLQYSQTYCILFMPRHYIPLKAKKFFIAIYYRNVKFKKAHWIVFESIFMHMLCYAINHAIKYYKILCIKYYKYHHINDE